MNTGYLIEKYKNTNVYSSTYNTFKTERILDLNNCPLNGDYAISILIEIPENNYTWESRFYTNLSTANQYYSKLINWGDGSTSNMVTSVRPTHTYEQAGSYIVTYFAPIIGNRNPTSPHDKLIKKVLSWGVTAGIIQSANLFKDCDINEIAPFPNNYFNNYISTWGVGVNTFSILQSCFENNTNLTTIPDNLNINVGIINKDNFVNFDIYGMFRNTAIRKVPIGFLNFNNIQFNKISFDALFENCSNLTEVDDNAIIGINNLGTGIQTFNYVFRNCNLNTIPNLFNEFRKPTSSANGYSLDIYLTFAGNSNMTGEALPYWTTYNSSYIYLYGSGCYTNCTALSNYNAIPSGWK